MVVMAEEDENEWRLDGAPATVETLVEMWRQCPGAFTLCAAWLGRGQGAGARVEGGWRRPAVLVLASIW